MKKLPIAIAAVASLSGPAYAGHFTFSEAMGGGKTVTGSFDGTASGNLITDLSNISVTADGTAYTENGALGAISWADFENGAGFDTAGSAVLSFDGTQNDFFFFNSTTNNFFHGRTGESDASFNYITFQFLSAGPGAHMIITAADDAGGDTGGVPESASWALMLCGFGAVGGAMRARRRAVSFG